MLWMVTIEILYSLKPNFLKDLRILQLQNKYSVRWVLSVITTLKRSNINLSSQRLTLLLFKPAEPATADKTNYFLTRIHNFKPNTWREMSSTRGLIFGALSHNIYSRWILVPRIKIRAYWCTNAASRWPRLASHVPSPVLSRGWSQRLHSEIINPFQSYCQQVQECILFLR